MVTSTQAEKYRINRDRNGKKVVVKNDGHDGWSHEPFTVAEISEITKNEFTGISPEQIVVDADVSHWTYGTGTYRFFVTTK